MEWCQEGEPPAATNWYPLALCCDRFVRGACTGSNNVCNSSSHIYSWIKCIYHRRLISLKICWTEDYHTASLDRMNTLAFTRKSDWRLSYDGRVKQKTQPFRFTPLIALSLSLFDFDSTHIESATICAHSGRHSIGLESSTHDTGKRLNPISWQRSYPRSEKRLDKEEIFYCRSSRCDGPITKSWTSGSKSFSSI